MKQEIIERKIIEEKINEEAERVLVISEYEILHQEFTGTCTTFLSVVHIVA